MNKFYSPFSTSEEDEESIVEIDSKRTLFIEQFTHVAPLKPEIVHGLYDLDDLFAHFKPEVEFFAKDKAGEQTRERISFRAMTDFDTDQISDNHHFFRQLREKRKTLLQMAGLLQSDKKLRQLLSGTAKQRNQLKGLIKDSIQKLTNK